MSTIIFENYAGYSFKITVISNGFILKYFDGGQECERWFADLKTMFNYIKQDVLPT